MYSTLTETLTNLYNTIRPGRSNKSWMVTSVK